VVVNEKYCAEYETAVELLNRLASMVQEYGTSLVAGTPFYAAPGSVPFTKTMEGVEPSIVPWVLFSDGITINAGNLANTWTHGYDDAYIESELRKYLAEHRTT
jgi:hypothetical protein